MDTTMGSAGGASETSAGDVAQKGIESVRGATDQALGRAREQVDTRSTQVGQQMLSVADAARQVGENLRGEPGQEQPAKVVDAVAERVERLGGYLERTDSNSLLDEIDRLGRRSPTALVAGGVVVGIIAARFLKASSENRTPRTGASGMTGIGSSQSALPPAQVGSTGVAGPSGTTSGVIPTGRPVGAGVTAP